MRPLRMLAVLVNVGRVANIQKPRPGQGYKGIKDIYVGMLVFFYLFS